MCFKIVVFLLGRRDPFWSCNLRSRCAKLYCALQLSLCRSQYWHGCAKEGSSLLRLRAEYDCVLHLRVVARIVMAACKLRIVLWQHNFLHFGAAEFPFQIPFKNASKSSFFCLGVEIRFWSCNLCSPCAYFYCVLQRCLCTSQWT